ncbi:hypothetical protein LX16_0724 [Stackebrandtia albiflava]|uniref:SWIM-type domain-containing protein n=1 Tax=Stackebrandtia albiflava TaxID=406432 RepID=A0A562VB42_9ACTN|nr:hypothetical protein [Stackebrandtia albiflava]TWJ15027.1 hypothetical protein LX16_0724 [Stackebrandtia albiflava]
MTERHVGRGVAKFGRSWWGKSWLRTLEQLGLRYPDSRLPKARSLVTAGDVDMLHVAPGELSAWVDQPPRTFGVTVRLPVFTASRWDDVTEALGRQWRNLAELREDRLPSDVDRQLAATVGATLFPAPGELTAECPCRDRGRICLHVIAVQHGFAVCFDDDPFLLVNLRGGDRDTLLEGVRRHIAAATPPEAEPGFGPLPDSSPEEFYRAGDGLAALEQELGVLRG